MQIKINLTQKDNVCTSAYAIYKKNEQILEMNGNPKIVQNGDTFRAQTIKLDMDSQEITLSGRVKGSVVTTAKEEEQAEESKPADAETQAEQAVENSANAEESQKETSAEDSPKEEGEKNE